jgi:hypothetical protein
VEGKQLDGFLAEKGRPKQTKKTYCSYSKTLVRKENYG